MFFCYVNEMGKPLGSLGIGLVARETNHVIRRLEFSASPLGSLGREERLEIELANDLFHAYIMKCP